MKTMPTKLEPESEIRKTCVWCIAAAVAVIPLLMLVWYLYSASAE